MITFENLPTAVAELQSDIAEIKSLLLERGTPEIDHPLRMDEVCHLTGKSKPSIYRYVNEKSIPFHKQGGRLYFFKSEIIDWIKNQ